MEFNSLGFLRFKKQLTKLNKNFNDAKLSDHPSLYFYQSDSRQVLFYLESLCRLYRNIHDINLFESLLNDFKQLEDQLGKVDYYDNYFNELKNSDLPELLLTRLHRKYLLELEKLEELLIQNNWLKNKPDNILNSLADIEWLKANEETKLLAKTISSELKEIVKDYEKGRVDFNYLEEGVHEFRRKIRWISIYAQALDGIIQLKDDELEDSLSQYLTKEVVNSPFNTMPTIQNNSEIIYFSKSAFYALSWMIATIGKMKDEGLKFECIDEILHELSETERAEIDFKSNTLSSTDSAITDAIKSDVAKMTKVFITEHHVLKILRNDLKQVYKK